MNQDFSEFKHLNTQITEKREPSRKFICVMANIGTKYLLNCIHSFCNNFFFVISIWSGDFMSCEFGPNDWQLVLVEAIYSPCGQCEQEYLVRDLSTVRRARIPAALLQQPWQCVHCRKPFPTDLQCQLHEQYACVTCNCQSLDPISLRTNTSELWPIYKAKYNKTYNPFEDKKYFEIFKENVKKIAEHNQKFESGQCAEGDD